MGKYINITDDEYQALSPEERDAADAEWEEENAHLMNSDYDPTDIGYDAEKRAYLFDHPEGV